MTEKTFPRGWLFIAPVFAIIACIVVTVCMGLGGPERVYDEHGCPVSEGYGWCAWKERCVSNLSEECIAEGEIESFDACVSAGYPVMESFPRQCRTADGRVFVEDTAKGMTPELCGSARGHWNECSSRCRIDHAGEEGAVCPAVCDALCECGGIAGFGCPEGYACRMPAGIADALGYCVPASHLSGSEAYELANASSCMDAGRLSGTPYYNPNTRTWWIDLQPYGEKPFCHPACVVHEDTGEVEVNWRCTGLIPPQ